MTFLQSLKRNYFLQKLSSLKIMAAGLSLLFFLTFVGTVAQVEHGLYYAQQRYFNSLIFPAFGFLPFPGARLVLWVLFINLAAATVTRFAYRWANIGILTVHLGLILYLVSAFVTFHGMTESHLTLMEGEGANVSQSYNQWELSVWEEKDGKRMVTAVDLVRLVPGEKAKIGRTGLTVETVSLFPNAQAYTDSSDTSNTFLSGSGIKSLKPSPVSKEPSENFPGGTFRLTKGKDPVASLMLFGGEQNPAKLELKGKTFFIQLRRQRYPMPLFLTLKDFKAEFHPNTEMARSYESDVEIHYGDSRRDANISMNKPLRHKEYTFYQSSYAVDAMGRELSTLAVVRNAGQILPYAASLITFAGMAIHFLMRALKAKTRKRHEK